jgi:hypothetical protein
MKEAPTPKNQCKPEAYEYVDRTRDDGVDKELRYHFAE